MVVAVLEVMPVAILSENWGTLGITRDFHNCDFTIATVASQLSLHNCNCSYTTVISQLQLQLHNCSFTISSFGNGSIPWWRIIGGFGACRKKISYCGDTFLYFVWLPCFCLTFLTQLRFVSFCCPFISFSANSSIR